MPSPDPLILTAQFDPAAAAAFQGLRDRHFPSGRNIVPAHLTLFHHLPGAEVAAVVDALETLAGTVAPFAFRTGTPMFLGRGCALPVASEHLVRMHGELVRRWRDWLTAQDRQPFRPHVTVQNKVAPATARMLCTELAILPPITGRIVGLALWHYRGGPWELARHTELSGAG